MIWPLKNTPKINRYWISRRKKIWNLKVILSQTFKFFSFIVVVFLVGFCTTFICKYIQHGLALHQQCNELKNTLGTFKKLWFTIFLVHLLRVKTRSGSLGAELESKLRIGQLIYLALLDSIWHWLSLWKVSKECPENDEHTYFKCNLVNF